MKRKERESGFAWFGDKLKQLVYVDNADGNDSTLYAKEDSGSLTEFNGHRICFKIEIEEMNRWKEKHGHAEYRKGCHGKLYANGILVWECRGWDYEPTYKRISRFIDYMEELWYHIINYGKELIGRLFRYEGQLFVVTSFIKSQCCVIGAPVDNEGVKIEPPRRLPFESESIDYGYEIADDGYLYGDEAIIKIELKSARWDYKTEKAIREKIEKKDNDVDNTLKHEGDGEAKKDD